ncbi:MAG TPA: hypothetical protein VFP44_10160 [Usitatibacter sp.]|nr:hypothetical protein [Usitatibacter sp.]
MPKRFAYYDKLGAGSKRTYRKSDRILRVELPDAAPLGPLARGIDGALETGQRGNVESACQALVDALNGALGTPAVRVRVLERRPANAEGELQGLYEPGEVTGGIARITVWMRTAQREQVVKFRTFLRTLLHEVCHHLDYELYGLDETFHTEGFYSRESSLMRELLGERTKDGEEPGGRPQRAE